MKNTQNKLKLIYGDVNLGVHGKGFHCLFSYQRNGLESLLINGKEWLYREPQTAFWRATTDNDRGYGFSKQSAVWLGADQFPICIEKKIKVNNQFIPLPIAPENNKYSNLEEADTIEVIYTFETNTIPSTLLEVSYSVTFEGTLKCHVRYHKQENLPDLPAFGLRFIIPTLATSFEYKGLSGETYPDRLFGGVKGTYKVKGLPVTPYLVPQDCGIHIDTEWVRVTRNSVLNINDKSDKEFSLVFKKVNKNFGFSCIPYTPFELENAYHQEELPFARRTVLTIYGAVRGIGGIDSWNSGIEEAYNIRANENHECLFEIDLNG